MIVLSTPFGLYKASSVLLETDFVQGIGPWIVIHDRFYVVEYEILR